MRITVFTPTYNRSYIIEKLYRSLQEQTYTDFEWLVIDDGSSDNTEELFKMWKLEKNPFPIRYYKVKNGGKHRAINRAVDLAEGEMFFIVDSDDDLTEDALESIVSWENSLEDKKLFCGVSGNKGGSIEDLVGTTFEGKYIDATSLERNTYNIKGDKAEVFYTDILRKYKFREFEGEKFMTEATVWNKMAYEGYKIRWFNKTIYICNYLEDGLTQNMKEIFAGSPKGTAYYMKQQIEFYKCGPKGRLSYYNLYYDFVKSNLNVKKAAEYLGIQPVTLMAAIFLAKCKKIISRRS